MGQLDACKLDMMLLELYLTPFVLLINYFR